jgi:hypothetical protein
VGLHNRRVTINAGFINAENDKMHDYSPFEVLMRLDDPTYIAAATVRSATRSIKLIVSSIYFLSMS